ncbi:MAG: hypothetical protein MUF54_13705 [Polyangiaceae bacterium]|jgi:hypothetical protein|nr:hypothetical protein [Polyangiaceae bacterium]
MASATRSSLDLTTRMGYLRMRRIDPERGVRNANARTRHCKLPTTRNQVTTSQPSTRSFAASLAISASIAACACQPAANAGPIRSAHAQKWFDRARTSFGQLDIEDAQEAVQQAARHGASDEEIRLLAANIALAKLDYEQAIRQTEGMTSSNARAVRGRAQWYAGQVDAAGATLHALLRDPEVHDPWAKAIASLANQGAGRTPFRSEGDAVASTEMPRVRSTSLVVPVEIDGEQGLAVIATGTAEVVLDRSQRRDPAWVSVRIDGRLEFRDVPAVTQDLSGISRQLGAPIKALLGVNFLRHANMTFDFGARQFVVRRFVPPRPPSATDVPLYYIRGGGMMLRSSLQAIAEPPVVTLLVDSAQMFPIVLDEAGWDKAGLDPRALSPLQGDSKVRHGVVPMIRLGTFDVPKVAGVLGTEIKPLEQALGLDVDGIIGSGLLAAFRVTLGDAGHVMWIEEEFLEPTQQPAAKGASTQATSASGPLTPPATGPDTTLAPGANAAPTGNAKPTGK